ncbi:MAG: hypothetical protein Q8K92_23515, partial [Leadbetterella sp.]|nr:hypothetical protein [Leadbetterella sp.]
MKKLSMILLMSLTMLSCQGQNENNKTTKTMDSRDKLMDRICLSLEILSLQKAGPWRNTEHWY